MASILYVLTMLLIAYTSVKVIKVLWKVDQNIGFDEIKSEKINFNIKKDSLQLLPVKTFANRKISLNFSSNNVSFPSSMTPSNLLVNSKIKTQLNHRRKAAKMLICVAIMFAICNLPIHFFNVIR